MKDKRIYTPEGVHDMLPKISRVKRKIETDLLRLFECFGYDEVQTPLLEFYDAFTVEKELMPQEMMFKFFDKEGEILVLRPDMTIPVARLAATKLKDRPNPKRLCYVGNTFRYNEYGGGRQREFTQAGIELIGADTYESDAEPIVIAAKALMQSGINAFQIDIGQTQFFKGVCEKSSLTLSQSERLRILIDGKDRIGLEDMLDSLDIDASCKELIDTLPSFFGSTDAIERARAFDLNETSLRALDNLDHTIAALERYGLEKTVSVDLSMVPAFEYYTGVIFKGFTHGIGYPLLSGGRYDNLVEKFGVRLPATGFSVGINMLLNALIRQKGQDLMEPALTVSIVIEPGYESVGYQWMETLRAAGQRTVQNFGQPTQEDAADVRLRVNNRGVVAEDQTGEKVYQIDGASDFLAQLAKGGSV